MKWIELFNDWIREVTKRITNIEQRIEKLENKVIETKRNSLDHYLKQGYIVDAYKTDKEDTIIYLENRAGNKISLVCNKDEIKDIENYGYLECD